MKNFIYILKQHYCDELSEFNWFDSFHETLFFITFQETIITNFIKLANHLQIPFAISSNKCMFHFQSITKPISKLTDHIKFLQLHGDRLYRINKELL